MLYLPERIESKAEYCKDSILKILLLHDLGEIEVGDIIPQYEDYSNAREMEKEFGEKLFLQGTHKGIADLTDIFSLWQEWCNDNGHNINISIAKEIDKIQMIFKMFSMLRDGEIILTNARILNFWSEKNRIVTDEGKRIFNTIIANGRFDEISAAYGIHISQLH